MVEWNWRCERVDLEVNCFFFKKRILPTRTRPCFLFSADLLFFLSISFRFPSSVFDFLLLSSFRQLCPFPPLSSHVVIAFSKTERSNTSFSSEHGSSKKKCLILVL